MARLRAAGRSVRQIAAGLDRSPSTVARELRRNGSKTQGYRPSYAQQQVWTGTPAAGTGSPDLRQGWSPQQVSGRFALESGGTVISHETIYRFIYAQLARAKNITGVTTSPSPTASPTADCPSELRNDPLRDKALRQPWAGPPDAGADSRLLAAVRVPGKAAEPLAQTMAGLLAPFPPHWGMTTAPISMNWVSKDVRWQKLAAWIPASAGCAASSPDVPDLRLAQLPRPPTPHAGAWGLGRNGIHLPAFAGKTGRAGRQFRDSFQGDER